MRRLLELSGLLLLVLVFAAVVWTRFESSPEGAAELGTGDLPEIVERGTLRVALPPLGARMLPRRGDTLGEDLRLARELAASLGLELVTRTIADRSQLLQSLDDGLADLAIARLTVTPERRRRVAFSVPLDHDREMLVVSAGEERIRTPEDLAGRSVAVRASSSFYDTLMRLRAERVPEMTIVTVDERIDTEDLLYRVGRGDLTATVADASLIDRVMAYRDDLRVAFPLGEERPIAWAMRREAPQLREAVDRFLERSVLTSPATEIALGDLDAIRERKTLRVLTRNNAVSYFLHRGQQVGFEFELARRFAKRIGCRLQVVVPPSADQLIPWLEQGRGDLIAANMTITPARASRVAFSRPYHVVDEWIVVRADDPLADLEEIAGREIAVRLSSSYFGTLARLQREVPFAIVAAPETMETEALIAAVAAGEFDATVADSHLLGIELAQREDVRGALTVGESKQVAWAVRPEDAALLEQIDAFLVEEHRSEFFNVLTARYFKDDRRIVRLAEGRSGTTGRISEWDELFKEHAAAVDLDWRLLAATAYAESEFDPRAVSWAGAVGLMQVTPAAARQVGVEGDLLDPESNIRAASRYLRWLYDVFDNSIPPADRMRFVLAAYNAGLGHMIDGRRLAREQGWNPNRWEDNVERSLALLATDRYARRMAYGYCRCRQTLAYVNQVTALHAAYVRIVD